MPLRSRCRPHVKSRSVESCGSQLLVTLKFTGDGFSAPAAWACTRCRQGQRCVSQGTRLVKLQPVTAMPAALTSTVQKALDSTFSAPRQCCFFCNICTPTATASSSPNPANCAWQRRSTSTSNPWLCTCNSAASNKKASNTHQTEHATNLLYSQLIYACNMDA